ncbi:MAG: FAD-dependent oxidoreductase [Acidobacteriaceae bacterium]|nr:FAD-dependent oxidoreductase [Acidobacteriaceae bacterium]
MPHTPLLSRIVDAARQLAREENAPERPARLSRRSLLAASAAAALPASAQTTPRLVIVGAGLAGLTCAYRLAQNGLAADIFDANTRVGGRCWSLTSGFDNSQIIERGGELIDQGHTAIRQLCQELRLPLDNLLAAEPNGAKPFYFFHGLPYPEQDAVQDLKAIWPKIKSDLTAASYPTTYYQSTPRGRQLDAMSILDWINESVPGGLSSRLGQLLAIAYNIEYGEECSGQSALNLIYLLGYRGPGQLRLFGPSNEKYHVRGGNEQIAARLAAPVAARLRAGHALTAITRNFNGSYTLQFQAASRRLEVTADRVILALPFSLLRTLDFSGAGFSNRKQLAIREQGIGANAKFHLQFRSRHWNALGNNGDSYSDTGYQASWEVTRAQSGASGILVNYSGGNPARRAGADTPAAVLARLEPVFPGLTAQWNGKWQLENWPANPLTRGSYSYWKPGQYQSFAGVEGESEGACHFCGEHTSLDFQGYLNGAVETGERAAREVASAVLRK